LARRCCELGVTVYESAPRTQPLMPLCVGWTGLGSAGLDCQCRGRDGSSPRPSTPPPVVPSPLCNHACGGHLACLPTPHSISRGPECTHRYTVHSPAGCPTN
jgi:hypothetical protein